MKTAVCRRTLVMKVAAYVAAVAAQGANTPDGVPATIPNTKQYDFKSKINGQTYRLWINAPAKRDPAVAYPVFYSLDGSNLVNPFAFAGAGAQGAVPAILVAIGYATDDPELSHLLRVVDLTTSPLREFVSETKAAFPAGATFGGGDTFLRVIEEEVKPFVQSRYRVDLSRQTFYGHSLAGLIALRALFRNPKAFSTYCIASPSIWYNNRDVLSDEAGFSKRVKEEDLRLRILITSAGDEQRPSSNPLSKISRMVDNASELAGRLASLNPASVKVTRVVFAGETHNSVMAASIARALRFALAPE